MKAKGKQKSKVTVGEWRREREEQTVKKEQ
jgi:hypothetical protein